MTDANPTPPDSPDGTGPDPATEYEIERILAEVGGLADELGEQLGTQETSPGSIADLYVEDTPLPENDLEAEFDQVEAILEEVKQGEPGQSAAGESQGDPAAAADPPGADSVAAADDPGAGSAALEPPIAAEDAGDAPDDAPPRPAPTSAGRRLLSVFTPGRAKAAVRAAGPPMRAAVRHLVAAFLKSLDVIDGLFAFISYDVRRLLSWLALVLFIAACAITASSWSS